jgi:YVTN family beta-propeller protein
MNARTGDGPAILCSTHLIPPLLTPMAPAVIFSPGGASHRPAGTSEPRPSTVTMLIRTIGLFALAACTAAGLVASNDDADLRTGYVLVANQQSSNASLIDLRTDSARLIPVPPGPHEAVISPSGRTGLITAYGVQGQPGNQLVVIDIASGTVRRTISLGEYTRPHGAGFLPGNESRAVVTSETTQNLVVVDLDNGTVVTAIPTQAAGSHMVAITADGRRAWTSNVGSGSTTEIDLVASKFVRSIPVGPRSEGIAVAPDGSVVLAGSNTDGTVSVIDTKTGTTVETMTGFKLPYRLAASADGRIAIVCDAEGNSIQVIDIASRKVAWTLDGLGAPRGVNISPDGKTAFVTLAGDQTVAIIDLEQRKLSRKIGVGASPDGVWYGPAPR